MNLDHPLTALLDAYRKTHMRWAAESTIKQYLATVSNLRLFLGREPIVGDLADDFVLDVMAWFLKKGRGRTPRGANKVRSNIRTLWTFACRKGWLSVWPDVEPLKIAKHIPVAWLEPELKLLFEVLMQQPGMIGDVQACWFWIALHCVLYDTGERIGAVMKLPWDSVFLSDRTLIFRAETRKRKTRDRLHKLHPDTCTVLQRIRRPGQSLVFNWTYCESYLWVKYKAIREKAGLPTDRKHQFHCMRKTAASFFEAAGGNATLLLDHSSRSITIDNYLDERITGRKVVSPCDVLARPQDMKPPAA